jgi:hypothetical protein
MNTMTVLHGDGDAWVACMHGDPDPGITAKNGIRILRLKTRQFAEKICEIIFDKKKVALVHENKIKIEENLMLKSDLFKIELHV